MALRLATSPCGEGRAAVRDMEQGFQGRAGAVGGLMPLRQDGGGFCENVWYYDNREREPMRQGQQNRRGRGRNRKSQNPLTRSFESNGPDVKIRGTPAHIAEKYISLARDALSSGDPVLAESYLQHAEHYNRIIMAFREQHMQQGGGDPAQLRRPPGMNDFADGDDMGEDGDDDMGVADAGGAIMGTNEPQPTIRSFEPQPQSHQSRHEGHRNRGDATHRQGGGRDRHMNGRHGNDRRQQSGDADGDQPRREMRHSRDNRDNRENRDSRDNGERAEARDQQPRPDRQEQGGRRGSGEGRRAEFGGQGGSDQPEFLRRSVRRPRRPREEGSGAAPEVAAVEDSAD